MKKDKLTLQTLRVRAVNVPMASPVETSGGTVGSAPYLLLNLETKEGVEGCAYVFCYTPRVLGAMAGLCATLGEAMEGDPVAPLEMEAKLQGLFRLLGGQGLAGMVLSGIDMAAWDALAKAAGLSLASLLGGGPGPYPPTTVVAWES